MKRIDENYFKINDEESMKKNSIEDVLAEGEQILWREKPNKKAYVWSHILPLMPIALIWLIFDAFFIVMMVSSGAMDEGGQFVIFIILFFILHLAPVWLWLINIIRGFKGHKNVEYAFTDKRIIIKSGIIGIDFKNIYYSDVDSVNVKVGMIDRILKVGDIYIKSDGKASVIYDIKNPYEITSKLQKITFDIKTDVYYPNALRPDENPGYNTKYKG